MSASSERQKSTVEIYENLNDHDKEGNNNAGRRGVEITRLGIGGGGKRVPWSVGVWKILFKTTEM